MAMEPEVAVKTAEELGEEDLVDYEEEDDAAQTEKPTDTAKEGTKKYAPHTTTTTTATITTPPPWMPSPHPIP